MSTFYGFEIAKTGLFVNQKALDVTAHNVANANTKGYTRQRIHTSSIEPSASVSLLKPLTKGDVGGGTKIMSVEQLRDLFLDRQYRNENSILGEHEVKADVLSYVEGLFKEPSDTGVSNAINQFLIGLQELSKNVGSKDVRTNLVQQALSLTDTINYYARQLDQVQKEQDFALTTSVDQVNEIVRNIVALNERIANYEIGGQAANDLRDRRNMLLDDLSKFFDISYSEELVDGQKQLKVSMHFINSDGDEDSIVIIDNADSKQFTYDKSLPDGSTTAFNNIYIEGDNENVHVSNFTTGMLRGYMDMRDGDSEDNKGVQYFIDKLDTFARTIAMEINKVHSSGYTYPNPNSENPESLTGINFFEAPEDGDYTNVNASNLKLSEDIINNVFNIAASREKIEGASNTGNNEIILELIELFETEVVEGQTFDGFMRSYVSQLGVATAYSTNMVENQDFLLSNIENNRMSVSGVSLDEEMANMVKFGKSYQAAARMITVMDEMLDIIINKTGIVGR